MERRDFLTKSTMAATAVCWPAATWGDTRQTWSGYSRATIIDALGAPGGARFGERVPLTPTDVADVKTSGLTALNLTVGGFGGYAKDFEEALRNITFWDDQITANPEALTKAKSIADLVEAKKSGRVALIYGFQDATPFGESLDRFDLFYSLGLCIIQLTYNLKNLVGDGCLEPRNAGLSLFGRELVARLNEKRVVVDLSHCGRRTTLETIELSRQPVAITHAGCTAVADLPRNKTDEELRKLADKGGAVGIYLMPFLRTAGQPMAADVIQHIEHALDVCGEDHVGIGTDGGISPINLTPEFRSKFREEIAERRKRGISAPGEREDAFTFVPDLNSPRRLEILADLLAKRGHSDTQITKILGDNFKRLFTDVWG
ncbi:MAG TPA: membrane dipeptidase [Chthoniobacterales bacterium]|jgi:membrane dipeptidase